MGGVPGTIVSPVWSYFANALAHDVAAGCTLRRCEPRERVGCRFRF